MTITSGSSRAPGPCLHEGAARHGSRGSVALFLKVREMSGIPFMLTITSNRSG